MEVERIMVVIIWTDVEAMADWRAGDIVCLLRDVWGWTIHTTINRHPRGIVGSRESCSD